MLSAAACIAPRMARAATTGRQPYLQRLLADRVSVLWTTPQAGAGTVAITDPSGTVSTFTAVNQVFQPADTALPSAYCQYLADITGLKSGTKYSYQVAVDGQILASGPAQYNFTTPAPGSFSVLVFGDSGADSPEQIALVQMMAAEPSVAKVIHAGDLAYFAGTFAEFDQNYFGVNAPLMSRLPFFATPGNHDYETANAAAYLAGHAAPAGTVPAQDAGRYYSYDFGDAHFVSVDSNLLPTDAGTRMLAWLDADLAATGKFWKIVFLHHPPYPTGAHLDDPICAQVRQSVNPIVERHGVQLVLSGHEHGYERSWPLAADQRVASGPSTTYVITGGGGQVMETIGSLPQCALSLQAFHYCRIDINGNQLLLTATDINGNVIDTFGLTPSPVVTANSVLSIGDYTPAVAAGSLACIFGQNLAVRADSSSAFPLPSALGGVNVTANGIPVPLLYVSPTQLNVQIPFEVAGQVTIGIETPNGLASTSINVLPVAPSILAVTAGSHVCSTANPAAPSAYVTVYATGLGPASAGVGTGGAAPMAPDPIAAGVQVWLNDYALQPSYAGTAPGFAGLNQINFAIPANWPVGPCQLRISANQTSSKAVALAVAAAAVSEAEKEPSAGRIAPPIRALLHSRLYSRL